MFCSYFDLSATEFYFWMKSNYFLKYINRLYGRKYLIYTNIIVGGGSLAFGNIIAENLRKTMDVDYQPEQSLQMRSGESFEYVLVYLYKLFHLATFHTPYVKPLLVYRACTTLYARILIYSTSFFSDAPKLSTSVQLLNHNVNPFFMRTTSRGKA